MVRTSPIPSLASNLSPETFVRQSNRRWCANIRWSDPQIPAKSKIVTLAVGPEQQKFLQMVDPAADTLCGAGLTVEYADGRSYSGDPFSVATVKVQCDEADAPVVQKAFAAVWTLLASG